MQLTVIGEALSRPLLKKLADAMSVKPEILRDAIARADIDVNRLPYGDWIAKSLYDHFQESFFEQYSEEPNYNEMISKLLHEHAAELHILLGKFDDMKSIIKNRGLDVNISSYTAKTLANLLDSVYDDSEAVAKNTTKEGVEYLGQSGQYRIYKASSVQAVKELGEGTKWCTRGSYENSQAEQYISKYGYLFIVMRSSVGKLSPFMQICSDLSEPRNAYDQMEEIPPDILRIIGPHIKITGEGLGKLGDIDEDFAKSDLIKQKVLAELNNADNYDGAAFINAVAVYAATVAHPWPEVMKYLYHTVSAVKYLNATKDESEKAQIIEEQKKYVIDRYSDDPLLFDNSSIDTLNNLKMFIQRYVTEWPELEQMLMGILKLIQNNSAYEMQLDGLNLFIGVLAKMWGRRLPQFEAFMVANLNNDYMTVFTANGERWPDYEAKLLQKLEYESDILRSQSVIKYVSRLRQRWPEWETITSEIADDPDYSNNLDNSDALVICCLAYTKNNNLKSLPTVEKLILANPFLVVKLSNEHIGEYAAGVYCRARGLAWPEYGQKLLNMVTAGKFNRQSFGKLPAAVEATGNNKLFMDNDQFVSLAVDVAQNASTVNEKMMFPRLIKKVSDGRWPKLEQYIFNPANGDTSDVIMLYLEALEEIGRLSKKPVGIPNLAKLLVNAGVDAGDINFLKRDYPTVFKK